MATKKTTAAAPVPVEPQVLSARVIDPVQMQFSNFLNFMPNPDLLLAKTGQPLSIYREMLLDGKISSLLDIRKCSVLEHPRFLKPADDTPLAQEIADFVQECYDALNDYQDLKDLLSALDFGFSVAEVIWELWQGKWWPVRLEHRKQERFGFQTDFTPYLLQDPARRPLTDPCKFIVHRNGNSSENPYGTAVLSMCYWPWVFKKAGWRFWMQAADKFGCPSVMALFDCDNTTEAARRATTIATMLAGIRGDGGLALANVKEVKALEMSGSLDGFETLIRCANAEISYAVTGQSLATSESQYGSRAQGEVHERIIDVFTKGDARALAYTENKTLVSWIVLLNYGPDAPVPLWEYDFEDDASWETVMGAIESGIPLSLAKLYDRYNLPKPKDENDVFLKPEALQRTPAAVLNLADAVKTERFPDQDAVDAAAEKLSTEQLQQQMEGVLKPVVDMIQKGTDYEDILNSLAAAYPDMHDDALQQMLARAIFVTEVWGRLNAGR